MIDWLRERAEPYLERIERRGGNDEAQVQLALFFNYLERTGASPWRSVEDEPTEHTDVIVSARIPNDSAVGYWEKAALTEYRFGEFRNAEWATHWMPVPPLPKEEP